MPGFVDPLQGVGGASVPAVSATVVSPSDNIPLISHCRALYIGVTGDVAVQLVGDNAAVTFKSVAVGILPISCSKVMSTNTTASNILALS